MPAEIFLSHTPFRGEANKLTPGYCVARRRPRVPEIHAVDQTLENDQTTHAVPHQNDVVALANHRSQCGGEMARFDLQLRCGARKNLLGSPTEECSMGRSGLPRSGAEVIYDFT